MIVRLLRAVFLLLLVPVILARLVFLTWPLHDRHPALQLAHGTLAIRGATVYTSPEEPPLHHASVLVRDGRIAAVGAGLTIPPDAQLLPCNACTVTAGFWNAHVQLHPAALALRRRRPRRLRRGPHHHPQRPRPLHPAALTLSLGRAAS